MLGQLMEIAKIFFGQYISVQVSTYMYSVKWYNDQVLKKEQRGSFQFVQIKVHFDNSDIEVDRRLREKSSSMNEYMPVESAGFLKMFPFFIAFNKVLHIGA